MSKVRINDLARELEVKSRAILDALTHVGVTEKKTHSSSLEADEAERVRQHFHRSGKNGAGAAPRRSSEPKQKIDWSRVSKPGDVLKAIQQRKEKPRRWPSGLRSSLSRLRRRSPLLQRVRQPPRGPSPRVTGYVSSGPECPAGRRCLGSSCQPQHAPSGQAAPSQSLPVQARPNPGVPIQRSPTPPPPPPAPRRIVPQPRQEPRIVVVAAPRRFRPSRPPGRLSLSHRPQGWKCVRRPLRRVWPGPRSAGSSHRY